jgi:bidirectional [NiFe] hydrogenase diaphorase subunit
MLAEWQTRAEESHMSTHPLDNELEHQLFRSDALIEALHAAQEQHGHLTRELLAQLAGQLQLPPSLVYGVASFYHAFRLEPQGEHHCTVCTGTSCHIRGGTDLLRKLEKHFGISSGETAADGSISLDTVRCLGVCGLAPLVVLDGHIISGDLSSGIIDKIFLALETKNTP